MSDDILEYSNFSILMILSTTAIFVIWLWLISIQLSTELGSEGTKKGIKFGVKRLIINLVKELALRRLVFNNKCRKIHLLKQQYFQKWLILRALNAITPTEITFQLWTWSECALHIEWRLHTSDHFLLTLLILSCWVAFPTVGHHVGTFLPWGVDS